MGHFLYLFQGLEPRAKTLGILITLSLQQNLQKYKI